MLSSTMKYGAIRAKVMAMQGKMLSEDDFNRLSECADISDVINFLRNHRGWNETILRLPSPVAPEKLKAAVADRVWQENEKLYRFSDINDKVFLRFAAAKGEYELILSALRRLGSPDNAEQDSDGDNEHRTADFLKNKSSVDTKALETCTSWHELLEAVSRSIFAEGLNGIQTDPKTQLPNYSEACVLLENTYYREVFSFAAKKYKGLGQKRLKELLGREADYLNIVSLLRLHRYFPNSLQKGDKLLIPISYRLKPEMTSALMNAQNEAEAADLLKDTIYGQSFKEADGERLESIYEKAMSEFCRKLVNTEEPSACTAPAYLVLKELECRKLIRVIEAISVGVDPKNAI